MTHKECIMQNDYTKEEEEAVRKEVAWAFD